MKSSFFFIFICLIIACNNPNSSPTGQDGKDSTVTALPAIEKDSIHRIKLTFIGDIMGHGDQIKSAAISPDKEKSKDMNDFNYEPCFRYVKPIFEQADLMIGNLELTLSNRGNYAGYPMFKSPDALATYLRDAGFDILTTCNNHSNDGFLYGIEHTIDILDSLKIMHTGTFKSQEIRDATYPLIVEKEVDGTTFRLAFVNYTYGTNGVNTPAPAVVNLIDEEQMQKDIIAAKAANPDMIIAIMHWGNEYWLNESDRQVKQARFLWENGVDVVIGGHPHVIEPIKTDTIFDHENNTFREVLVTYSLGNFISNQSQLNTDMGLIFELELVKNSKTNKTVIGNHDYILIWRYIMGRYDKGAKRGSDWTYVVVPVAAFEDNAKELLFMTNRDVEEMNSVSERMRKHLGKWQSKERKPTLAELGPIVPLKVEKKEVALKETKKQN